MAKVQIRISLDEELAQDLKDMGNGAGYSPVVITLINLAKNTPNFDPFGRFAGKPVDTTEDPFKQE